MGADVEVLRCRTYTHARRFPLVIGKVGGYALPTPLTPTQAMVLLGTVTVALSTRDLWARFGGPTNLLIATVLPIVLAWAVRHASIEGRTPLRTAVGLLTYLARPRRGRRAGRPVRPTRPVRIGASAGGWR